MKSCKKERKLVNKLIARRRPKSEVACGYIVVQFRIVSIAIQAPTWNPVVFSVRSVKYAMACPMVRVDSHQKFRNS